MALNCQKIIKICTAEKAPIQTKARKLIGKQNITPLKRESAVHVFKLLSTASASD